MSGTVHTVYREPVMLEHLARGRREREGLLSSPFIIGQTLRSPLFKPGLCCPIHPWSNWAVFSIRKNVIISSFASRDGRADSAFCTLWLRFREPMKLGEKTIAVA